MQQEKPVSRFFLFMPIFSMMIAGTSRVDVVQAGASIRLDDDISFTGAKFRIH